MTTLDSEDIHTIVKTRKKRNKAIFIYGLGGIGSWIVEPIVRMTSDKYDYDIVLIDGDHYSDSNKSRQSLHPTFVGRNKSECLFARMNSLFPEYDHIYNIPSFINEDNIKSVYESYEDECIHISCVDNNYFRKILNETRMYDSCTSTKNDYFISPGNALTDGNVHFVPPRSVYSIIDDHPEIAEASKDQDKADASCQELEESGEKQIIVTNFMAAALTLQTLHKILSGSTYNAPRDVYFDIETCATSRVLQDGRRG